MDEIFIKAFTEELADLYEVIGLNKEASAATETETEDTERPSFIDILAKIASK